ncbi:MAG: hypothetical protein FWG55_08830 [Candidatus Bathyarchaeota archaeon]|nr:hypothetical protein [Candidatus Termiticorpusculum sp.]
MSSDKEKLNQLSIRVEELLITINKVTEELRSISASIKLLSVGQPQSQPAVAPKPITPKPTYLPPSSTPTVDSTAIPQTGTKLRSLDDVRMSFPEELEAKLGFEDKDDYITIKPKQFLGSDNFAKIASAVRGMGGEYISAGKDSHFRVPKKKPTS